MRLESLAHTVPVRHTNHKANRDRSRTWRAIVPERRDRRIGIQCNSFAEYAAAHLRWRYGFSVARDWRHTPALLFIQRRRSRRATLQVRLLPPSVPAQRRPEVRIKLPYRTSTAGENPQG